MRETITAVKRTIAEHWCITSVSVIAADFVRVP
jgi:hypothetical protein